MNTQPPYKVEQVLLPSIYAYLLVIMLYRKRWEDRIIIISIVRHELPVWTVFYYLFDCFFFKAKKILKYWEPNLLLKWIYLEHFFGKRNYQTNHNILQTSVVYYRQLNWRVLKVTAMYKIKIIKNQHKNIIIIVHIKRCRWK